MPTPSFTSRLTPARPAGCAGSWRAGYLQRLFRHAPADHDPVILRHRRIYILPTRRGYAFLATLGMTLLTSLNYSLSLGFVATFMLAGLVATALVHTFRNLSGIELRPLAAGETFAGAVMPFTLALAGGATPRYAVTLTARGCSPVTVDVLPDSALPVALELLTPRRGRIVLGRVTLSSEFPMGLWHAWAYVHFPLAGIAFPTPEVDPPPLPTRRLRPGRRFGHPRHRRGSRRTARVPARRSAAAHRVEVGRARRRLAHETVRGRQRRRTRRARLGFAARRAAAAEEDRAPHRVGARRRARGAAVRAARSGHRARRRARTRPSPGRADGTRADAGAIRISRTSRAPTMPPMRASHLFFKKQRRAPMPPGDDTLSIGQTRWLGALMLGHAGADARVRAAVDRRASAPRSSCLRFVLIARVGEASRHAARDHPVVGAGLARGRHGDRDPRAHGLFHRTRSLRRVPVRADRHQVSRNAPLSRRHADRLPRVPPDRDAVLLQPVAARRGRRRFPPSSCSAARCRRSRGRRRSAAMQGGWRTPLSGTVEDVRAGDSARGDAVPAVSRGCRVRCGACRPIMRPTPAFPITWRRATSASCRCPTPSRSASISTAPCLRRGCAIGAVRC